MRLLPMEVGTIRAVVTELAGADARVRLFGSRTDDAARGGDIDLLVEVPNAVERPAVLAASIAARLEMKLGGRRIDVVLDAPNLEQLPVHRIARACGQLL